MQDNKKDEGPKHEGQKDKSDSRNMRKKLNDLNERVGTVERNLSPF